MKILLRIVLLCGVFFFMPGHAFSWGKVEHQVIARIAWDNLKPEAQTAVVELMLRAPEDSRIRALFVSSADNPMMFFVNASFWADIVRNPSDRDRAMKYS